jgi:hypothetical protein
MPDIVAHFTPTELPGTMAIWVAGIGLGLALGARATRAAIPALTLLAALAGLAMLGDAGAWAEPVRVAIDAAFLLAAVALAAVIRRDLRARSMP